MSHFVLLASRAVRSGLLLLLCLALWAPVPARAQPVDPERLLEVMRIDDILSVMQREGLSYASDLDLELLEGRGGSDWQRQVARIYDEDRMRSAFAAGFGAAIEGQGGVAAAAEGFFGSDLGQQILSLEISAREAMLEDAIDAAAREAAGRMLAEGGDRPDQIAEFIAANDLMEQNVVSGLNASLAFYRALVQSGGLPYELPEADLMAQVWASEPELRSETRDWMYAFLGMAYAPLSAEELDAYIAYSRTPEGQALNRALFAGFDAMFLMISEALGRAAGDRLSALDL